MTPGDATGPRVDRDHIEREVKLEVDERFVLPALEGASPLAAHHLDAVYHDTIDLRLLDQGITVRRRTGDGTIWTVKFPSAEVAAAGGVARREVDVDSDAVDPPPTVSKLVEPFLGGGVLGPVARLVSVRERLALIGADGQTVAEVDDDRVSARALATDRPGLTEGDNEVNDVGVDEGNEVSFREIEVEFDDTAPPELIETVVGRFHDAGARASDGTPKVERALALLGLR